MFNRTVAIYVIALVVIISLFNIWNPSQEDDLDLYDFELYLEGSKDGELDSASISGTQITGRYRADVNSPPRAYSVKILPQQIEEISRQLKEYRKENPSFQYSSEPENGFLLGALQIVLPVVLLIGVWFFILRQMQIGGGKAMSFGKSRARLNQESGPGTTFADVAGCEEAKEELQEIVEFLKDPRKFQRLGGRIPRGVLLIGPPGTGKTLLARAISGEASVPFYSISGSDFVEMFVGVGASRVRDLFEQGKKNSPCLIFIDEIDAVGRQRFAGVGGGHDEREQTLNQLLVEMDGFNSNEEVILIAATNRPDVLDPALLRPGRFDRQVTVDTPDLKGRAAIFGVHTKNVVLADGVDLISLARKTPGFSGADIQNCVNEAALLAARNDKDAVEMADFEEAVERVSAGPERKSRAITEKERKVIAYHEAGHAVVIHHTEEEDLLHKVSILPRGQALGYTMHVPSEDRYLRSKCDLLNHMTGLLGGRVAEELVFGDITTGAQNDLERVSAVAHQMVRRFGMSEKLGPLTFGSNESQVFLGRDLNKDRDYSETIAVEIDTEIRGFVDQCHIRAREILEMHNDQLDALVEALLEREVLSASAVLDILEACESDDGYTTRVKEDRAKRDQEYFNENTDGAEKPEASEETNGSNSADEGSGDEGPGESGSGDGGSGDGSPGEEGPGESGSGDGGSGDGSPGEEGPAKGGSSVESAPEESSSEDEPSEPVVSTADETPKDETETDSTSVS